MIHSELSENVILSKFSLLMEYYTDLMSLILSGNIIIVFGKKIQEKCLIWSKEKKSNERTANEHFHMTWIEFAS